MLLSFFLYYLFISSVYRLFLYGSCNTVFYVLRAVTSVCSQESKAMANRKIQGKFASRKHLRHYPLNKKKQQKKHFTFPLLLYFLCITLLHFLCRFIHICNSMQNFMQHILQYLLIANTFFHEKIILISRNIRIY